MAARLQALSVVALLAVAPAASGADLVIYDDQSRNGFDQACTWGTADFASTDVVRSGAFAIRFVPDLFRGLSRCTPVQMPVTIEWMAATGRDHPLWTVTYDLSGAPPDRVSADSRSPYGNLAFDGSPGAPDVVQAVGWGDRYRFASTSAGPVTLNSPWTWNVPNTVPHTYLFTANVDAEMGIVLTQDYVQQDAGGYWGYARWNTTSAAGNASLPPDGNHVMPCDFNWPYQTINYSFKGANTSTTSKRMAWGTNFGFLGRTSYPEHGFGGFRSGYPRQSYSVYVALDRRTPAPTAAQVAQVEAALASALAADMGTVLTSGPAGVNRPDTLPTPPASVRLDGVALAADVDYFASVDATRQRLWITVNRAFLGAHALVVTPP
jgi:hypothetical protein